MHKAFLALALLLLSPSSALAFPQESCGDQTCADCHFLTREEAKEAIGPMVEEVLEVNFSEVKGLWEVVVAKGGKKFPVYIDFSRRHILSGEIIRLETMENLTGMRFITLNKLDVSRIPLEDALVLGKADAPHRIIVFEDPECPYCHKLYEELKEVVARRPDIAFLIKLFPLKIHPAAYDKAKAIFCAKSLALLEDSLAGKQIPPPSCATDQIDRNIALAAQLGIGSVPTLVYPDGMVVPGFATGERILQLLGEAMASMPTSKP